MNDTNIRVWITSGDVLTQGVFEIAADVKRGDMVLDRATGFYYHDEGVEWHRTKAAAIERAEDVRAEAIARLHARLKQVVSMRLDEVAA